MTKECVGYANIDEHIEQGKPIWAKPSRAYKYHLFVSGKGKCCCNSYSAKILLHDETHLAILPRLHHRAQGCFAVTKRKSVCIDEIPKDWKPPKDAKLCAHGGMIPCVLCDGEAYDAVLGKCPCCEGRGYETKTKEVGGVSR